MGRLDEQGGREEKLCELLSEDSDGASSRSRICGREQSAVKARGAAAEIPLMRTLCGWQEGFTVLTILQLLPDARRRIIDFRSSSERK